MPAMNGFAVSRGRLIGCCMALVMLVTALSASSASAKPVLKPTAYVALGDSLAFGYTEQKFYENLPAESPSAFEGGYANVFKGKLAAAEKKAGNALSLINLGCPGETSESLLGHTFGGNPGPSYNPCKYHNKQAEELGFPPGTKFPLHAEYAGFGGESQLEAALGAIATNEVTAITLNIGSNDELAKVAECMSEAYRLAHVPPFKTVNECLAVEANGLFTKIVTNTATTIGVIRGFSSYKTGKIEILGFYNPQAFLLPGSDKLQKSLNELFEYENAAKTETVEVPPFLVGETKGIFVKGPEIFGPNVKYVNPFPVINPQKEKQELERILKYTEEGNEFDKHVNFIKYLEAKGFSKAEAEAIATPEASKAFPEGDIHPTPAGAKKLGNMLYKAF